MIVARGISVKTQDGYQSYVYGGCDYPEGMQEDQLTYFNPQDVSFVAALGYIDESEEYMQKMIYTWCNGGNETNGGA